MYRQGDVLLVSTQHVLTSAAKRVARQGGRLVLAHGEATGHVHAVDSTLAELFAESDGGLYLRVLEGPEHVRLVHEQHAAISLEPGIYQVIRQREYSPEAVRHVVD